MKSKYRIVNFGVVCIVALLLSASGCSEEKEPMGTIVGTVKADGNALGDCKVGLYSTASKKSIGSNVDGSGSFVFNEVPLGDYQVTVLQKPSNAAEDVIDERIPFEFRDRKTSGLSVSVAEGENRLDIDLAQ